MTNKKKYSDKTEAKQELVKFFNNYRDFPVCIKKILKKPIEKKATRNLIINAIFRWMKNYQNKDNEEIILFLNSWYYHNKGSATTTFEDNQDELKIILNSPNQNFNCSQKDIKEILQKYCNTKKCPLKINKNIQYINVGYSIIKKYNLTSSTIILYLHLLIVSVFDKDMNKRVDIKLIPYQSKVSDIIKTSEDINIQEKESVQSKDFKKIDTVITPTMFFTNDELAEKLSISKRTIISSKNKLKEVGLIKEIIDEKNKKKKRFIINTAEAFDYSGQYFKIYIKLFYMRIIIDLNPTARIIYFDLLRRMLIVKTNFINFTDKYFFATNKDISNKLQISEQAVKQNIKNLINAELITKISWKEYNKKNMKDLIKKNNQTKLKRKPNYYLIVNTL